MKARYIVLLYFLLPVVGLSQNIYWQGGLFTGIGNYSGDINPMVTPDMSESGLSVGVVAQTSISSKLGFRASLLYANLQGDDRKYPERDSRNFRFTTNLIELGAMVEWEPFGSNRYYADARGSLVMDKLISPYLFTGIAVGLANLDTDFSDYSGNNLAILDGIREDEAIGNSTTFLAIPIGVGVKMDITQAFTLALEVGGRYSFSDYIDGISAAAGDSTDLYFASGIILYYRFTQ